MTDSDATQDMVAAELMEVSWPWNTYRDELRREVERLSGDPATLRSAVTSFAALLRFRERHEGDVAAARERVPGLANAYWIAWRDSLAGMMPTMTDFTWTNFRRWAVDFNPCDIGQSWDEPPEEFIRAAGWIWVNGSVETATTVMTRWLIDQFENSADQVALRDFLEIATDFVSKIDGFALSLVVIINHAGKRQSLPYLKRLMNNRDLVAEVRESAAELYDWQVRVDD